jgi:hypothetical protein
MLSIQGNYWELGYEEITEEECKKILKALEEDDEDYLEEHYFKFLEYVFPFFAPHGLITKINDKEVKIVPDASEEVYMPLEKNKYYIIDIRYSKNGETFLNDINETDEIEAKISTFNYEEGFLEIVNFYQNGEEIEVFPEEGRNTYSDNYVIKVTEDGTIEVL